MSFDGKGSLNDTCSTASYVPTSHPANANDATKVLKPGGKLIIVSFHSIEDKIVKYFFSNFSSARSRPSRYLPENKDIGISLFDKYKNRIFKPSKKEINKNPPSRSAKLRYAVRSKDEFIYPLLLMQKFKKYLDLESIYA